MEHFQRPPVVYREACKEFHQRKVRCVNSNGYCQKCVLQGKSCIVSPGNSMIRPRKRKAVNTNTNSATRMLPCTGTASSTALAISPRSKNHMFPHLPRVPRIAPNLASLLPLTNEHPIQKYFKPGIAPLLTHCPVCPLLPSTETQRPTISPKMV